MPLVPAWSENDGGSEKKCELGRKQLEKELRQKKITIVQIARNQSRETLTGPGCQGWLALKLEKANKLKQQQEKHNGGDAARSF